MPIPRGATVIPRFQFEQTFLRSYTQAYSDDQRLQMIQNLRWDLENRRELLDGYDLYQIMVRIDGGPAQRLTANRLEVLRLLRRDVVGLNYDETAWIEGLFPNKSHPSYPEAENIIRNLSY